MTTTAKADKNVTTKEKGVLVEGKGVYVHSVPAYLKTIGADLDAYKQEFPDAPLFSDAYLAAKKQKEDALAASMATGATVMAMPGSQAKVDFAKLFDLGSAPAAKNARGEDIKVTVMGPPAAEYKDWVPAIDENYIFPIDQLKCVMVAGERNLKMLLWGKHGTGKTTLIEQFCARTNRPAIRTQHTVSTEEAHILGHYVVKNGATVFEPGPLPLAMRDGLVYIADEYDFALPSVTSVYQAVLEGKPLVIKEAPPEGRIVKPHENFRFYATGNTNGSGDETGLYTGTQVMNAANYSRFAITVQMDYMPEAQEIAVVSAQSRIHKDDATALVKCAKDIRMAFERSELSTTISPRELINAAKLARVFGANPDLAKGLQLAFSNRLNATDKKAVDDFAQRHFG